MERPLGHLLLYWEVVTEFWSLVVFGLVASMEVYQVLKSVSLDALLCFMWCSRVSDDLVIIFDVLYTWVLCPFVLCSCVYFT
jgi:hypothetical protein